MTITMEEAAKIADEAKERGRWEGSITAQLNQLMQQVTNNNTYNAELRGMLQAQGQSISELRAAQNSAREDRAEDRDRMKRFETDYVQRKELEEMLRPLKVMADRLNNWAWQVALASLGGSAITLAAGYSFLRAMDVLP